MRIVINADDFGLNHDVNMAIVEAFEKGYITNTTIMANMPGFEEAVSLSKEHGFFEKVGLHFNIFEGYPLSEKMKEASLFIEDGEMTSFKFFHQSSFREKLPSPFSSKCLQEAIKDEALKQVDRYLRAGFSEMHFDSHGHSHTFPVVWCSIKDIFVKNGFKTVRKSLNFPKPTLLKRVYKDTYNYLLAKSFSSTQYFASGSGFLSSAHKLKGIDSLEIMVHPVYDEATGVLRNSGKNPNFESIMGKIREMGDVDLIGYNTL